MTDLEEFNVDFNKICRICLKENTVMHSISSHYNDSIKFVEIFEYLIGDLICDNQDCRLDVFNICNICSSQLIISYKFKQQCIKSNEIISKLCSKYKASVIVLSEDSTDAVDFEDACNDVAIYKEELALPDNLSTVIADGENEGASQLDKANVAAVNNEKLTGLNRKKFYKSGIRQCLKCNLEFSNFKSYSIHHRQSHKPQVLCPLCGKLVAKHSLEKHLASTAHNKNKEHLCTECGKSFTLVENLEKHRRIHTGDKRYICEHCNMKFIHWNSKRSHIRSFHTGEKKYECNICGKRFAQSSNLFRHIRSHTGEMPHECSICHKKFKTSPELKNHLVVHTKERNHVCNVCKKAFGTKKSLSAHIKIHTGERNYVCTVCTRAFTQAHVLRSHLKTHPNCPIPPAGAVLSQKALNKPPHFINSGIKV